MVPRFTRLTVIQRVRHRRPPFWSGILQKRFKHAILVWSFMSLKMKCHTIMVHLKFTTYLPTTPIRGYGESPYFRSPQQHVPQCVRQLVPK